jgi:predicted cupin superfamily sugar epimerase
MAFLLKWLIQTHFTRETFDFQLNSNETHPWHFYGGDPLRLVLLYPDGSSKDVVMGNDPLHGQYVQFVIPAGVWQAGYMLEGGKYSLFGCTLAPGFTDNMFEGGTRDQLIDVYPEKADDINRLGCSNDKTNMPKGFAS